MKRNYIFVLTIVLSAGMLLSACSQKPSPAGLQQEIEDPIAVNVAKVEKSTVESLNILNGKVKPAQEVSIVSKVPGKVDKINFEVGDKVNKGDVLFTIDDSDLRLQFNQTDAALALAKSGAQQTVSSLKAALVAAETSVNNARLNLERMQQLYDAGAVSKQALESAETGLKVAEEQYNSAKTSYDLAQKGNSASGGIASTEAQIKQAQAAYDIAKSQLENASVESPISGVVATRDIDIGEMVGSGMPAMTVIDISTVTIDINVPESIVNKIHVNDTVDVVVQAVSDNPVQGRIVSISPSADQRTMSYPVKIKVSNEDGLLKGGMFAEIKLKADKAEDVIAVPVSSVVDESGKKFVYVVNGDKAEKREITIGFSNDASVQVLSGLNEGETIVVKGQNQLTDGAKITIIEK
jgi:HlyD family secretion protein